MNYFMVLALSFQFLSMIHGGPTDVKSNGGPVGKVTINKAETCPVKSTIKSKLSLNFDRANGDKTLNGEFTVPFNVDNNIKFEAKINKLEKNEYVFFQKIEGSLCQFIEANGKNIWDKFAKIVNPKVGSCSTVKKGTYTIKDWSVDNKDVKINYIVYGKFKAEITIFKGKEAAFCYIAEGESIAPK